jgi:hypothetical protein
MTHLRLSQESDIANNSGIGLGDPARLSELQNGTSMVEA